MDIKDTYTEVFLKESGIELTPENIKKYKSVFWFNFRSKSSGGLRLTEEAIDFISEIGIRSYRVDIPIEIKITPQLLLWLDQEIDSPYFLGKKHIIVLKERAAFELYLFSGDIRKFGYAKSLSKRFNSEIETN